ncbi:hypothetical protein KAU11_04975 [Candidatus Babeliales bacterium]|nr:hypothetical protein [Candidatus Babeliales bacterium]
MKTIYLPIINQLKTEVPALRWIDADMGQLDFYEMKPPVVFPCALIDIDLPKCEDLAELVQDCDATITIRLAFEPMGQTNSTAPESVQNRALAMWDTVSQVFTALQGFENATFGSLSRTSQVTEKRDDNIKVVKQVWDTVFEETA